MSTTTTGTTPTTAAEIHAAALARATELAEGHTPGALANMAECGYPEGDEGADALDTARNVAAEAAAEHLAELDPAEAVELAAEAWELYDATTESVWQGIDGTAVLTYTARYRAAFADLDGWNEDPAGEYGMADHDGGMDKLAQLAVFSIMRRAADAVVNTFATDYTEAVEDMGGLPEDDEDDTDD